MRPATLATPSQDSRIITSVAQQLLLEIYQPGHCYQKAGVQLSEIKPQDMCEQLELFQFSDASRKTAENRPLMLTVDKINQRFPKGIKIAATQLDSSWKSSAQWLINRYTTDWQGLATVYCK